MAPGRWRTARAARASPHSAVSNAACQPNSAGEQRGQRGQAGRGQVGAARRAFQSRNQHVITSTPNGNATIGVSSIGP